MQGIADLKYRFIDVSTGYPGLHDARVFRVSRIGRDALNGRLPRAPVKTLGSRNISAPPLLLADPAYRLMPYCMRLYPEGLGCKNKMRNFNRKLSSTRVVIEQAFGFLKGIWRCLYKETEYHISNVNRGDNLDDNVPHPKQEILALHIHWH